MGMIAGSSERSKKAMDLMCFAKRYEALTLEFKESKIESPCHLNSDDFKAILLEFGYKTTYYKSEKFFKIQLGDINNQLIAVCHLQFSDKYHILTPHMYVMQGKDVYAGGVFSILYKLAMNMSGEDYVEKLYYQDRCSLKELIGKCLSIAVDFKDSFVIE